MALWLILALMTTAALAAIALPFAFGSDVVQGGSDIAVYKDQLTEIDRDLEAGLIETGEAGAARTEVSRRLLQAADTIHTPPLIGKNLSKNPRMRRLATFAIALCLLPVLAGSLYLRLGSPAAVSAVSVADRTGADSDDAVVEAMVAQVEDYLKQVPGDGRGWETLAPVYMRMGRYDDAIRAWQNTIASLGDNADREENLGESLVAAANGVVTKEASRAFDRARSIDPDNVAARFYAGLAAKQDGRRDEAARIWRDLIAASPRDAEWVDTVRDALARLDEPSAAAADIAQAPAEQQVAMIKTMVESLAARLKTDGRDPDGWLRLARSYNVLGDRDKANAAVADARNALAQDPDKLAQFEDGLKSADQSPREEFKEPASAATSAREHDNATIQAMVDRLAERLAREGGDADSWFMLARSYATLGERSKALAVIARARQAFASEPESLSHFDQLSRDIEKASGAPAATAIPPKPETQNPAVADADSGEQQMTMIKGMVDRLAERLRQDGHDLDGWAQLMRSYVVLGQRDQAVAAGQRARIALSDNAEALRRIDATAKELGISLP